MTSSAVYQMMPALDAETEAALRASIEQWGVLVPVVVNQHGEIIDGHHRARIADELGRSYRTEIREITDDIEAYRLGVELNMVRRGFSTKERRVMSVALYEQGHTTRAIGEALGSSQSTIMRDLVAAEVESRDSALPGRTARASREGDREAMFALAAERDERGIGIHPMTAIAGKFGCSTKTVLKHLSAHPRVAELPARRWSSSGREARRCFGMRAIPAPPPAKDRHPIHRRKHRIDPVRIVNESVITLEAIVSGLDLVEQPGALDAGLCAGWIESISKSITALQRFIRELHT